MGKPSEGYTFHILSNEDYDKLPYPRAKDSVGMSIMDKKTAYIRQTGNKTIDQGTISHEFDELMSKTSLHEENGIRYKGWLVPFLISTAASYGASKIMENQSKQKLKGQANRAREDLLAKQRAIQASLSGATRAFAPQTAAPLGQDALTKSLGSLDMNAQKQQEGIRGMFRGQTRQENTQFDKLFRQAQTGATTAKNTFLEDQRKLGSTIA